MNDLSVCAVTGQPAQKEARFVRIHGTDILYRVNPEVKFTPELRAEVEARLNPKPKARRKIYDGNGTDVHNDSDTD